MNELELKSDIKGASVTVFMRDGGALPVEALHGAPSYMELLDALTGWQLVRELRETLGCPAAAVCCQASPVGAAIGLPLGATLKKACLMEDMGDWEDSPLACAYARAKGADRLCSFGDWTALSEVCDETTAQLIRREVSSGVIAPGYTPRALEILKSKRGGDYCVMQADQDYTPPAAESRELFGVTLSRARNDSPVDVLENIVTANRELPTAAKRDLTVALITLKYTQSSAVCYASDGQTIGIGSGQPSRIYCTRLAGKRADVWHLRQHPKALGLPFLPGLNRFDRDDVIDNFINPVEEDVCEEGNWQKYFIWRPDPLTPGERQTWLSNNRGICMASDGFFPFDDNIERARRSGVRYIAVPGGSPHDREVIAKCDGYDMVLAFTGAYHK